MPGAVESRYMFTNNMKTTVCNFKIKLWDIVFEIIGLLRGRRSESDFEYVKLED